MKTFETPGNLNEKLSDFLNFGGESRIRQKLFKCESQESLYHLKFKGETFQFRYKFKTWQTLQKQQLN